MPYKVEATASTTASPELVFDHLAKAEAWGVWGKFPGKAVQEREAAPDRGGVGSIRRIWPAREETVVHDRPHAYSYVLLSGVPLRDYRADVTLTPEGGGTRIHWASSFDSRIPGSGPVIHLFMKSLIRSLASNLARHTAHCPEGCIGGA
ncbi:MAG: SRPBCC family protein [Streptosporangiaceae bacterium]